MSDTFKDIQIDLQQPIQQVSELEAALVGLKKELLQVISANYRLDKAGNIVAKTLSLMDIEGNKSAVTFVANINKETKAIKGYRVAVQSASKSLKALQLQQERTNQIARRKEAMPYQDFITKGLLPAGITAENSAHARVMVDAEKRVIKYGLAAKMTIREIMDMWDRFSQYGPVALSDSLDRIQQQFIRIRDAALAFEATQKQVKLDKRRDTGVRNWMTKEIDALGPVGEKETIRFQKMKAEVVKLRKEYDMTAQAVKKMWGDIQSGTIKDYGADLNHVRDQLLKIRDAMEAVKTARRQAQIQGGDALAAGNLLRGALMPQQMAGATPIQSENYSRAILSIQEAMVKYKLTLQDVENIWNDIRAGKPAQPFAMGGEQGLKAVQAYLLRIQQLIDTITRKKTITNAPAGGPLVTPISTADITGAGTFFKDMISASKLAAAGSAQRDTWQMSIVKLQEAMQKHNVDLAKVKQMWQELITSGPKPYANAGEESLKRVQDALMRTKKAHDAITKQEPQVVKLMMSWEQLGHMLLTSLTYRAIYGLIAALRTSATEMIALQKNVVELQTISQNLPLTFERWFEGLSKISSAWGIPLVKQTAAAYEVLSNQVAEGAEALAFMNEVNRFAVTAVTDLKHAGDLLTAIMNAYNLSISEATHVSAVFFKTIELGRVRAEEMSKSIGDISVMAAQLGITFEELGATIATITIQGIKYDKAATQIRGIMMKLISPTEEMRDLFKSLGVESGEDAIKLYGLGGFLKIIQERTLGTSTEMSKLINRIRGLSGALALTGQGFEIYNKNVTEMNEAESSYARATAYIMQSAGKNLEKQLESMRNYVKEIFGKTVLNVLGDITNGFTGLGVVLRRLVDFVLIMMIPAIGGLVSAMWKLVFVQNAVQASSPYVIIAAITATLYAAVKAVRYFATEQERAFAKIVEATQKSNEIMMSELLAYNRKYDKTLDERKMAYNLANEVIVRKHADMLTELNAQVEEYKDTYKDMAEEMLDAIEDMVKGTKDEIKDLEKFVESLQKTMDDLNKDTTAKLFDLSMQGQSDATKKSMIAQEIAKVRADLANTTQAIGSAKSAEDLDNLVKDYEAGYKRLLDLLKDYAKLEEDVNKKSSERKKERLKSDIAYYEKILEGTTTKRPGLPTYDADGTIKKDTDARVYISKRTGDGAAKALQIAKADLKVLEEYEAKASSRLVSGTRSAQRDLAATEVLFKRQADMLLETKKQQLQVTQDLAKEYKGLVESTTKFNKEDAFKTREYIEHNAKLKRALEDTNTALSKAIAKNDQAAVEQASNDKAVIQERLRTYDAATLLKSYQNQVKAHERMLQIWDMLSETPEGLKALQTFGASYIEMLQKMRDLNKEIAEQEAAHAKASSDMLSKADQYNTLLAQREALVKSLEAKNSAQLEMQEAMTSFVKVGKSALYAQIPAPGWNASRERYSEIAAQSKKVSDLEEQMAAFNWSGDEYWLQKMKKQLEDMEDLRLTSEKLNKLTPDELSKISTKDLEANKNLDVLAAAIDKMLESNTPAADMQKQIKDLTYALDKLYPALSPDDKAKQAVINTSVTAENIFTELQTLTTWIRGTDAWKAVTEDAKGGTRVRNYLPTTRQVAPNVTNKSSNPVINVNVSDGSLQRMDIKQRAREMGSALKNEIGKGTFAWS